MTASPPFTAPQAAQPILHSLATVWWLVLLRGLAGIVFAILAFVWPGLRLLTLVLLYGACALVDGVCEHSLAAKCCRLSGSLS